MAKNSYIIRTPNELDKPDIMEIAKTTWGGHDHLPEMFDSWLNNPSCHSVAIEVKGKVISLGNVRLIEDGETGWLEGLRVHEDYRQKGYARIMIKYLLKRIKELAPIE